VDEKMLEKKIDTIKKKIYLFFYKRIITHFSQGAWTVKAVLIQMISKFLNLV